mmetsp:Transcript_17009/g.42002  ORF Transcript_17009/g.42002 Transcript_17009/m.42002 type:complete len:207 (-) Transcript_17009:27-647(-)
MVNACAYASSCAGDKLSSRSGLNGGCGSRLSSSLSPPSSSSSLPPAPTVAFQLGSGASPRAACASTHARYRIVRTRASCFRFPVLDDFQKFLRGSFTRGSSGEGTSPSCSRQSTYPARRPNRSNISISAGVISSEKYARSASKTSALTGGSGVPALSHRRAASCAATTTSGIAGSSMSSSELALAASPRCAESAKFAMLLRRATMV